jgi:glutamate synthase (NADPH/NADH) small chain
MGLAGVNALQAEGEDLKGVEDAVDYIARLRQTEDKSKLPVGRKIVVIGGGNTAIDIAVQTKRLGAEDVTIVYRRGPEQMSATHHKHWAKPVRVLGEGGQVRAIEFEYTEISEQNKLVGTGERFQLAADQVFKAIGQTFVPDPLVNGAQQPLQLNGGRIVVDADRRTSLPGVYAGGDCVFGGQDLTVQAVQDGKLAAHAIDRYLRS